ncbi:hypothetical protein PBI_GAIA_67 [Mycobacterium phage Gaia]|uniref:GP55 protein n=1 Tax=Mycobacterium phage Gaia TaxID=1486472 RepID=A0A068F4L5_9CAUD|nr:hypothetical protein VC46_gp166 [Mycobacterium phage Gaia]AID58886.1 hypothetical protein PBI_GAIA_67 [Mycobacterium phage Gaia]AYR00006.1 hypothetical protein PBI_NEBKISS_67 [Mycobacterium phage Nebkiss]
MHERSLFVENQPPMALTALLVATLICITWSLWIRRLTWGCRWEVAATLNIALQGGAVILMSPAASQTIGHWLHRCTGEWNLEDYIGHDLYIVAASAVVYNALGRLDPEERLQQNFKQYVERPATICIPLLLALFSIGNGVKIYMPDFFDVPTDLWLNMYWLLLCGILTYLLGYGIRALSILREDPRSRRIANIYLLACWCGIMACIVRVVTAFAPPLQDIDWTTNFVWGFACLCGAGFALTSAHSWMQKMRGFQKLLHGVKA